MHGIRHLPPGHQTPVNSSRFSKPRSPFGDPTAALKGTPRFIAPPFTNLKNLVLPLEIVLRDPGEEKRIEGAGRLVFHCVGDTGGSTARRRRRQSPTRWRPRSSRPPRPTGPPSSTTSETWSTSTGYATSTGSSSTSLISITRPPSLRSRATTTATPRPAWATARTTSPRCRVSSTISATLSRGISTPTGRR